MDFPQIPRDHNPSGQAAARGDVVPAPGVPEWLMAKLVRVRAAAER